MYSTVARTRCVGSAHLRKRQVQQQHGPRLRSQLRGAVGARSLRCDEKRGGRAALASKRLVVESVSSPERSNINTKTAAFEGEVIKVASGEEVKALEDKILSGQYTRKRASLRKVTQGLRRSLRNDPAGPGKSLAFLLAQISRKAGNMDRLQMPEASGDPREIVGQPVFVPLYKLFLVYGSCFRLSFGPKSFVIVSDPELVKHILVTNSKAYSKGILTEILSFVMGNGLIPANGEIWRRRRKSLVPALHKKYIEAMISLFGDCSYRATTTVETAIAAGEPVEMEEMFSKMALDVIGKAVFNYDFDSLSQDSPVIRAVYTALREAEHRSLALIPYWKLPFATELVPRQRRCKAALEVINESLDELIERCKKMVEDEDIEFDPEYLNDVDPSILHFLLASGDEVSSKQLRDDLMTLLIAGHETTAAVLTWTFYLLAKHPHIQRELQEEVDRVIGDGKPSMADLKELWKCTRVINESMRLYPQPPILIRRLIEDEDQLGPFTIRKGEDIFISVWNLHRSPRLWEAPESFQPFDRWSKSEPHPNEYNQDYKYLPFGAGSRKCVGDQFALLESICCMAMLLRRFDFQLDPTKEVSMTTGATIHTTNGLWMKPVPRTFPEEAEGAVAASAEVDDVPSSR